MSCITAVVLAWTRQKWWFFLGYLLNRKLPSVCQQYILLVAWQVRTSNSRWPLSYGHFVETDSEMLACQMLMHHKGWLYLQYRKPVCFSNSLPRASSSAVSFKAFAVSCFSRQLQSFLPTNGAGKAPATSQHDRGFRTLSPPLTHILYVPSFLFSWGKLELDITACEEVIFMLWQRQTVWAYFR